MKDSLDDYFEALRRIRKGIPRIVSKGSKITNDLVSLEAGRKKGSIKKSRAAFRELIAAIDDAARNQLDRNTEHLARLNKVKQTAESLRTQLDAALSRELSLLAELYDVKKRLTLLTGEQVIPIRQKKK